MSATCAGSRWDVLLAAHSLRAHALPVCLPHNTQLAHTHTHHHLSPVDLWAAVRLPP